MFAPARLPPRITMLCILNERERNEAEFWGNVFGGKLSQEACVRSGIRSGEEY